MEKWPASDTRHAILGFESTLGRVLARKLFQVRVRGAQVLAENSSV